MPGPTCLASGLGSVAGEEQGAGAEAQGDVEWMWGQCGGTGTGWMVGRSFFVFPSVSICCRFFGLECSGSSGQE